MPRVKMVIRTCHRTGLVGSRRSHGTLTPSMATLSSVSIQLPDLPTLTRAFELRANKACRSVSLASEACFLNPNPASEPDNNFILSRTERALLPSVKIGLLSSLCFPTCDPPQLRFLTDFMTLLTFTHERLIRARNLAESGWCPRVAGDAAESDELRPQETVVKSGIEILNEHELFKRYAMTMHLFLSFDDVLDMSCCTYMYIQQRTSTSPATYP